MSFEKLAQQIANHPDAAAHAAERAAELARKPFHDGWLTEVYPHWQGPLVSMHRKAGIESALGGHTISPGFPPAENAKDVEKSLPARKWLIAETLTVTAVVGVGVMIAYVFGGDENDGAMVRLVGLRDGNTTTLLGEQIKQWAGPKAKLLEEAVADVPTASALFGPMIFEAFQRKEARLQREEEERKAEAKRVAEAEEAKKKAEAEEKKRIEEAALVESRRLEAERKAKGEKPAEPDPTDPRHKG